MGKKKYYRDYETHTVDAKDGKKSKKELVYLGKYYEFKMNDLEVKKIKIFSLLFSMVFIIIFIFMGFINNNGSRTLYVVLPYIIMFLPIIYVLMGSFKLYTIKEKMTFVEYDTTIGRVKRSTMGVLVISLATVLGEIIYLLSSRSAVAREFIFLGGSAIILLIAQLFLQFQKKIQCEEIPD